MKTNFDKINEILARHPKARKIAVENFVMTRQSDIFNNQMNLDLDARLYGWNEDTINAINEALNWHYDDKTGNLP